MSSRKTYFGIGWTGKAPAATEPEKSPDDDDRSSDYSAPTVVDEAKVAEGLKQLRAWYQPDAGEPEQRESVVDSPSEPTKLGMPYQRPTAVGHGNSMPVQEQRQLLHDQMRGTMFGHDVHRPEIEAALEQSGSALLPMTQTVQPNVRYAPEVASTTQAPFAAYAGKAESLPRSHVSYRLAEVTDSVILPRSKLWKRLLAAGVGFACFVVAAIAWYQIRGGSGDDAPTTTSLPAAAPIPAPERPATTVPPVNAGAPLAPAAPAAPAPGAMPAPATAAPPVPAPAAIGRPTAVAPAAVGRPPVVTPPPRPTLVAPTPATPRAAADTAADTSAAQVDARPPTTGSSRRSTGSGQRRSAPAAAPSETDGEPAGVKKSSERRRDEPIPLKQDDDATLPPSEE